MRLMLRDCDIDVFGFYLLIILADKRTQRYWQMPAQVPLPAAQQLYAHGDSL